MKITRHTNEIKVYSTGLLTASAAGAISHDTTESINGEILKIVYDKGTFDNGGDLTIKTKEPVANLETIHTQTGLATDIVVYPAAILNGAAAGDNKWCRFVVNDILTIAAVDAGNAGTVTVYIYYK